MHWNNGVIRQNNNNDLRIHVISWELTHLDLLLIQNVKTDV